MKDRILQIMNNEQMNLTSFAKVIDIKPATLSHILNGRNNPSLDVIMKIHSAFKYINIEWLIYGNGEMYTSPHTIQKENIDYQNNENLKNTGEILESNDYRKEIESKTVLNEPQNTVIEGIRYIEKPSKKIKEIKIFFDDDTYETFVPQK